MKYNWQQGIKRFYIACAVIWYCFFTFTLISEVSVFDLSEPFFYGVFISVFAGPIALYYIARWVYQGFASEEKAL